VEQQKPDFSASMSDYFKEQIVAAIDSRKLHTAPLTVEYLTHLLEHYAVSQNLFANRKATLAEMYLKAFSPETPNRAELLKSLGDVSLYISGFFGDSLNRKIVDIDYYADMGGAAYGGLAVLIDEDPHVPVYQEFSQRFMEFVDLLTFVSQRTMIQTNSDLLRLYDRYVSTGSRLAEEQLIAKGLLQVGQAASKNNKQ
jgi:hypothetical protein